MLAGAAALVALLAPSSALAGTYTWSLASDFTATAPGANPGHDHYGGAPWRYQSGGSALTSFSTAIRGGLAGWQNSSGQSFVAINPTGGPIANGTAIFPAGQIAVQPTLTASAQVVWTSPIAGAVQISGAITQDDAGTPLLCMYSTTWNVTHGGSTLASGAAPNSFSKSTTVNPGDTIAVAVSNGLLGNPACDSTGVVLTITAPGSAPAVSLATPGNGGLISGSQPTFSGSASSAFGASRTVTVRVYQGSSAGGTPVQTLAVTRSGSGYSVAPSSPLPDGVYTARAEQDDLASPPDAGFSSANTFQIFNGPPSITLDPLGARALLTSTPTFTGVTGSAAGASGPVKLTVYPGPSSSGAPAGSASGPVGSGGHFSVRMGSALADGQYTVVASRSGTGGPGFSAPQTFRIKVHAPAVRIDQPAAGSRTSDPNPVLTGTAGTSLGDDSRVTVSLFAGGSTSGTPLGSVTAGAGGGTWSVRWPHKLRIGRYTAQVMQADDAGHTGLDEAGFRIVPAPKEIGSTVAITRGGVAAVAIGCVSSGRACAGDVLILTVRSFRTVAGGPAGRLRVMFAYVTIPAGRTVVIRRQVQASVVRVLRRARRFSVRVLAALGTPGGTVSAVRRVKIGT